MDEFVQWLQALGPFSTPVCVVLALGITWLSKDRGRILDELTAALDDAKGLRESRVNDLRKTADEYREHSLATQKALQQWTEVVNKLLEQRG